MIQSAKAFAPASVANVAVGFDLLGFSAGVTGDTATVTKTNDRKVTVEIISGLTSNGQAIDLPTDPKRNTATAGLVRLIEDLNLPFGFHVAIEKGIPMGSGLGGSASSAVAAIFAANALLEAPLTKNQMLSYALIGESVASNAYHADNVAPSLYGGFTLSTMREVRDLPIADVIELPIPEDLWCVLLHPHVSLETKMARGILSKEISLQTHIKASANLATVIASLYTSDLDAIRGVLSDIVIEPQRAHLIPGFEETKAAALAHEGTLGCSISGAGPSIFALAKSQHAANEIKTLMMKAAAAHGPSTSWAFALKKDGARILA